jgi:ketosteroid isomerase-like protein
MSTEKRAGANLAVVGGIYEAFGRGDIDFILGQFAEDCVGVVA